MKTVRSRIPARGATMGWADGALCNVLHDSGRVRYRARRLISDPFWFYAEGALAVMVEGVRGAVTIDRISVPVKQYRMKLQKRAA